MRRKEFDYDRLDGEVLLLLFCGCFGNLLANSWRLRSAASNRAVIALSSSFNFSFSCVSFITLLARFWTFSALYEVTVIPVLGNRWL